MPPAHVLRYAAPQRPHREHAAPTDINRYVRHLRRPPYTTLLFFFGFPSALPLYQYYAASVEAMPRLLDCLLQLSAMLSRRQMAFMSCRPPEPRYLAEKRQHAFAIRTADTASARQALIYVLRFIFSASSFF